MKLDDNFLSWLSKRNITQDTDGDFVKKCLYTWWGTIRQQVPNLKKSSDNHIQYISVFLEYYTIWLDTLDQNSRERAPEVTEILEQINKKIYNQNQSRRKVISEWYNSDTGFFEYELEDGTWIQSNKTANKELLGPDLIEKTFGRLYKRLIYPHLFRDELIEKLFE